MPICSRAAGSVGAGAPGVRLAALPTGRPWRWLGALRFVAALVARGSWRWSRRGGAALWRSLRPYGTASWRHPPRGA